jgi:hypothetical protein
VSLLRRDMHQCFGHLRGLTDGLLLSEHANMKVEFLDGGPPCKIGAVHKSCWIQADSFTKWFTESFTAAVKPSFGDPVVLVLELLEGRYWHTRNSDIIDVARANGVSALCPLHAPQASFMQTLRLTMYGK